MHFKINLTLVSILVFVLYFSIPVYNTWLNSNLLNPAFDIVKTSKNLDLEQRKIARFGYSYGIYKQLPMIFKQSKIADPVILLPPDEFLRARGVTNISSVEPAIFYYFVAEKSVLCTSPNVDKANCALVPTSDGKVTLQKINSKEQLDAMLTEYRKYKSF